MNDARQLRSLIQALVRRFSVAERADVSCCGTTVAQMAALEALDRSGPLAAGPLARGLGISPSTLSRNLDRMENAALVARVTDPADGRCVLIELRPAGRRALAEARRQAESFLVDVLDQVPAPVRQRLIGDLRHLVDAITSQTERCCPGAFDHLLASSPDNLPANSYCGGQE